MSDNTDFDDIFNDVGQKYGIDPLLLKAHAQYESGLDPKFKNKDSSASGLGAFTDATAKDYAIDRDDPRSSIEAQAQYLSNNLKRATAQGHDDPAAMALSMYKTGPNAGTYDGKYVADVSGLYDKLKKKYPNGLQDTFQNETKLLGMDDSQAPKPEDFSHEEGLLGLNDAAVPTALAKTPQAQELAAEVAQEPGQKAAPSSKPETSSSDVVPATGTLSGEQLGFLKQTNPKAYQAYMDKTVDANQQELLTGLGDVPRSLGKTLAAASPEAYAKTAETLSPAYEAFGGQPLPKTANELNTALQQRNDKYEQQYGGDPDQAYNRIGGQLLGSAPIVGAAGKIADATKASNLLNVSSNAVVNPLTGAVEKTASLGNKLLQYASSGGKAAALSVPFTASTDASSNQPVEDQLKSNAALSGTLGAAGPLVHDAGVGLGNIVKSGLDRLSSGAGAISEKAQSALNELSGGPIGNLDLTQYVPGSKPTLAEAAVDNPNVAALHTVLKEGNPAAGELTIPDLTARERENDLARRDYLDTITGSPDDLVTARNTRKEAANNLLYGNPAGEGHPALQPTVWQSSTAPTDVKPVVDTIDNILTGPNKKNTAVISAMNDIKDKLVNKDGSLEKDPETLYRSVIKDINDKLDKATPMDSASQNMQAAAVQVRKVKDALNKQIQDTTPGYKNYLQTYAKLSQPVDEYKALQGLNFLNEKSDNGVPTLAKVNNALDTITKKQAAQGFTPYDSVTDKTILKLQNLRADLQRAANPNKLLRIVGSPTDPKIAARKKVGDVLGTNSKRGLGAIGGSSGAMVGGFLGEHFGGGLGATVAAPIGEEIGRRGGNYLEGLLTNRSNLVKDQLVNTMLNPGSYNASAPSTSYLKSVGEKPLLQKLLRTGIPASVVEQNNFVGAR